jgi:hypothetical protein
MKRIFVLFLFAIYIFNSFAQIHRYYCEVKGIEKELSSGLKIIMDFGNTASYNVWGDLSSKLKFVNEKGEVVNFNSMVDAGNYMSSKGWTLQQAYSSVYSDNFIIQWIFYKDAESPEEAIKGIVTKEQYKNNQK